MILKSNIDTNKMLTKYGYRLSKSELDDCVIESLYEELTVKPFNDYGNDDGNFCVCYETKKYIYLPKYFGIQKFGIPITNTINEGKEIKVYFKGNLLENQYEPIHAYLLAAKDLNQMGGILQLPPGYGKTVMALYIISQLSVRTLIVVHKEFLMNQWKERIDQYLDNASIGIIKQKRIEYNNDIVIASLQSICSKKYDDDIFKEFGLVIIDECHHVGAQVFSQALKKVNFKYSLGLSATVNRKDGLTKVFKWHIGDIVYKVKQKKILQMQCVIS